MSVRTGLSGLVSALATSLVVLGALSLSLTEGMVLSAPTSLPEPTLPPVNLTPLAQPATIEPSPPIATAAPTITIPVLVTPTENLSVFCERPSGWETYVIQAGDTLDSLAAQRGIPVEQLMAGNCLISPQVIHGTLLSLPIATSTVTVTTTKTSTSTATTTRTAAVVQVTTTPGMVIPSPVPCGPFPGWVRYRVQKGDTLFSLSRELNTSVSQLQHANCLGSSTLIRAGDWLWVPKLPYRTATPTRTATDLPPKPTGTNTPVPTSTITNTPTATFTVTVTPTTTMTVTTTPSPTATDTDIPLDPEPPSGTP